MRNAAATLDDDFGSSRSPRRSKPRPRSASGDARKKKSARRPLFGMHGVARYAGIGMAAIMALGIVVNALMLQKGHHPAPLFARSANVAPEPVAPVPPPVVRQAAPAAATTMAEEAAPAKSHKNGGVARVEAASAGDPIARLLAGDGVAAKVKAAGKGRTGGDRAAGEVLPGDGKTVSAAQRALTKLGFKVPATGTVGAATRKAIEAFQKDRHLPVKGELDRRMVKLLSAESGMKIE